MIFNEHHDKTCITREDLRALDAAIALPDGYPAHPHLFVLAIGIDDRWDVSTSYVKMKNLPPQAISTIFVSGPEGAAEIFARRGFLIVEERTAYVEGNEETPQVPAWLYLWQASEDLVWTSGDDAGFERFATTHDGIECTLDDEAGFADPPIQPGTRFSGSVYWNSGDDGQRLPMCTVTLRTDAASKTVTLTAIARLVEQIRRMVQCYAPLPAPAATPNVPGQLPALTP